MLSKIIDYDVIESGINLSDHLPIVLKIELDLSDIATNNVDGSKKLQNVALKNKQTVLRWDHSNLSNYYSQTFILFETIHERLKSFNSDGYKPNNDQAENIFIEHIYTEIVEQLNRAASSTII